MNTLRRVVCIRRRKTVSRVLALVLACVLSLLLVSVVLALEGPVSTPPGGVTVTYSDPSGRQIGIGGGLDVTYSDFDFTQFRTLYWGAAEADAVALAFDGAVDTSGETMTFNPAQSDLANGMARWTGSARITYWAGSGWTSPVLPTRFTLRVTDVSDNPIPMAQASELGIPGSGAVITVTGDFKANLLIETDYGGWQPALSVFNPLPTRPELDSRVLSWFDGEFYYIVNTPPVAGDDAASTPEDTAVTIAVLGNDNDADGDPLSVVGVDTSSTLGQVTDNGDGTLDYDPNGQFEWLAVGEQAADVFSYTIGDGYGGTDGATVTVTVMGVNDAPVAGDDGGGGFTTDEDTAFTTGNTLTNDDDPDTSDTLSVTSVDTTSTVGQVTDNGDGTFGYDPDDQFDWLAVGEQTTDAFTYTAGDGHGGSDTAAVTITITGVNDRPDAVDDSASTAEDTPRTIAVLGNDGDVDGDPLLVIAAGSPLSGTTGTDGTTVAYTPTLNFNGQDVFTYTISDGSLSDTATVTVTVGPENDPPDAVDDTPSTPEDTPCIITVLSNDSDPENDTLVIDVLGVPVSGTASIDGSAVAYTPTLNFNGQDVFTYTVSDGVLTDTATVTITVEAVNDMPEANDDSGGSTDEDTAFTTGDVLANDTDPDTSDTLSVAGVDASSTAGSVTDNGDGTFEYDPDGQFEWLAVGEQASDAFTYTVGDGHGGTDTAAVTVTVTGVNDAPMAGSDTGASFTTDEDSAFTTGDVLANDSDPDVSDTLSVAGVDASSTAGSVTDNGDGTFGYDPDDQFEWLAAGEQATDAFTYTVGDGHGTTDTAVVTITITGANDGPAAHDDGGSTDEDTAFTTGDVLANDTDPDTSDTLSVAGVDTSSTVGQVTDNGDGTFEYDPDDQFEWLAVEEQATDTFTYTVSDGHGGSDTAVVTITITGINDGPAANDDSGTGFTTDEDTAFTTGNVLANDSDPDTPGTLSVSGFDTTGTLGQVTDNGDGTFGYDPAGQFEWLATGEQAIDAFAYTVGDSYGGSDTAVVTITITGVNDAPTAADDTGTGFITDEDTPFKPTGNVLVNDTDPDTPDTLFVSSMDTTGTLGEVSYNGDGTFGYDPDGQFEWPAVGEQATDTFAYTVSDGHGGTDTAVVTITIDGVNDAPTAADDGGSGFTTDEGTAFTTSSVLTNDGDPDASDTLSLSGLDATGTLGQVTDNGDGTFGYDPDGQLEWLAVGEQATDTFTYTVSDGHGGTDTAVVTITIYGTNDAPAAGDDAGGDTDEDTPFTTPSVLANDADPDTSDTLSVTGVDTTPTVGQVVDNGDGTFEYDPDDQFDWLAVGEQASDAFAYTIGDGHGGTDTAAVTVTVTGVNDRPVISDIPDQDGEVDTPVGPITFTVGDVDTPIGALSLSAETSDPAVVPAGNVVFGGSGITRTVTITPLLEGTVLVTITVDDGLDTNLDALALTVSKRRVYLPLVLNSHDTTSGIGERDIVAGGEGGPVVIGSRGGVVAAKAGRPTSGGSRDPFVVGASAPGKRAEARTTSQSRDGCVPFAHTRLAGTANRACLPGTTGDLPRSIIPRRFS